MNAPPDDDATRTGVRRPAVPVPPSAEDTALPQAPPTPPSEEDTALPDPAPPTPPSEEDTALPDSAPPPEDTQLPWAGTTPATPRPGRGRDARRRMPDKIGRFEILDEAGKGAMGVVYVAFDAELDRKVAIKLLLGELSASDERRLRREARAMAKVDHANVVAVHDVGRHEGRPFIAMDFVAGPDLRGWLREAPRAWPEIVEMFAQAGTGLAAAHDVGLIHRDFKPDNVLVATRPDGERIAKVADFGLASPEDPAQLGKRPSTRGPHAIDRGAPATEPGIAGTPPDSMGGAGTPAYMAPERWDGAHADARSDQFSFCVAMFEALAGQRPFAGDTIGELVLAITSGERASRPAKTRVPAWVWATVERGLEVDPEARFPSMRQLVARLRDDPRRRRRAWMLAGVAAVAALGIAGGRALQRSHAMDECQAKAVRATEAFWNDARRASIGDAFERLPSPYAAEAWAHTREAIDAYTNALETASEDLCMQSRVDDTVPTALAAERQACLDTRLLAARLLLEELANADTATIRSAAAAARTLPPVAECADSRARQLRAQLPTDPARRQQAETIRSLVLRARIRSAAGRTKAALPLAEEAVAEAAELDDAPTHAEALVELGSVQGLLGDRAAAQASFDTAIGRASAGHHAVIEAEAWLRLLWIAGRENPARAGDLVRGATAAIDRLEDGESLRARLETAQGSLRAWAGDLDVAIEHHHRALGHWQSLAERDGLDLSLELARVHNNIGWAFHVQGKNAKAAEHYAKSLALKERALGEHHPELATTLHNLGMLAREAGDLDAAMAQLQRALTLTLERFGDRHPRVANVLSELAAAQNDAGEHADAAKTAARALKIATEAAPDNDALLADIRREIDRARNADAAP